jgi:hypothetical protein
MIKYKPKTNKKQNLTAIRKVLFILKIYIAIINMHSLPLIVYYTHI